MTKAVTVCVTVFLELFCVTVFVTVETAGHALVVAPIESTEEWAVVVTE